jgi:hypothetical protein
VDSTLGGGWLDCSQNWLRTRLERLATGYVDAGEIKRLSQPEDYSGYDLYGHPTTLKRCGSPIDVRTIGEDRYYKVSVKAYGEHVVSPFGVRDQDFTIQFALR